MEREKLCQFLSGKNLLVCTVNTMYVASHKDFNEYCLSYAHKICPLYMEHINKHISELRKEHYLSTR
jgi:hypothetical protein